MSFQLLFAVAGTGMNIVSSLDTADYRSRVLSEFSQMRQYLNEINRKIDTLLDQNRQMLEQLDKLPEQIYQITDEIVGVHLLTERYVAIQARYTLYIALTNEGDWERSYAGFLDYNEDLHYIFLKEYRLSNLLKLIPASELAIAVYGSFALPVVRILMDDKISKLIALSNTMEDVLVEKLESLLTLQNNKRFVDSHNLSHGLIDFSTLSYAMSGHRSKTESYVERVCEDVTDANCCRSRTVCRNITRHRTVSDTNFNNNHDAHKNRIEKLIAEINADLPIFSNLKQVVITLQKYQESLGEDLSLSGSETESVEFVSFGAEEKIEKSNSTEERNIVVKREIECY